jgi:hypothetical protein
MMSSWPLRTCRCSTERWRSAHLVLIARQRLAVEQPWNKQWIIVVNHSERRHPKSAV